MPTKKKRKKGGLESVAILTIKRPGAMTPDGRRLVVAWLISHAHYLLKDGHMYTDKGNFVGRYLFSKAV